MPRNVGDGPYRERRVTIASRSVAGFSEWSGQGESEVRGGGSVRVASPQLYPLVMTFNGDSSTRSLSGRVECNFLFHHQNPHADRCRSFFNRVQDRYRDPEQPQAISASSVRACLPKLSSDTAGCK